ncbi:YcaO-like family protein [Geobacillus icigianus]|uniref:YcaO domain-containing protein n=1 Tax=Geobacillus subterraneus TaxID=129338 RepID=A0A679FWP2_9BACL|nr:MULTISPECIES: YcaO-like family protein [Geobacillus]KYD28064.1 hypothetical protein B4113_4050 [Geobacillus sp. B4113_201601]BBW98527.1 hypothetical protein GsuE55_33600 [Geobacillus subterraneus]
MNKSIYDLCQPVGGLMTYPQLLPVAHGEPKYYICGSSLGDLSQIENLRYNNHGSQMELTGAGGDISYDMAKFKSLAETLERYCSCVFNEEQFIWATAEELGEDALDLDQIPVCSENELKHPMCPILKPNKKEKIRWVRGISLTSKKLVWVPAIMVYLYIPYKSEGERFWIPISTGCAIHTSYEAALINAINEVIERDAISLTWLHRLPLDKIEIDISLPDWAESYLAKNKEYSYFETYYYNATTDLGIPTIYSVQFSPHNPKLSTVVMCSTELDPLVALTKITREAASVRIALQHKEVKGTDIDTFRDVFEGALYMGSSSMMKEFDFLKYSQGRYPFSKFPNYATNDSKQDLNFLIERLKEKKHEVIAVDLTTDEAAHCGFHAVRVIIPTLQPLSFTYRARYLGTKRLYQAPIDMGYGVRTEEQINPFPQPFA